MTISLMADSRVSDALPQEQVLTRFTPSQDSVKCFCLTANGRGVSWLALCLMQALFDSSQATEVMASAVEGGLIAAFGALRQEDELRVVLPEAQEEVLVENIARRLPRLDTGMRRSLASGMLKQLKAELSAGSALQVEGGLVRYTNSCWSVEIQA